MNASTGIPRILTRLFVAGCFLCCLFATGCKKKDDIGALTQKLAEAVRKGYLAEVQKLVAAHPRLVNRPGSDEMASTPLHLAVSSDRFEIAKFLLENGAEIDARNKHGMTALHLAAMNGRTDFAKLLLARQARKDIRDYWGQSPLMYATKRGHPEIASLLK